MQKSATHLFPASANTAKQRRLLWHFTCAEWSISKKRVGTPKAMNKLTEGINKITPLAGLCSEGDGAKTIVLLLKVSDTHWAFKVCTGLLHQNNLQNITTKLCIAICTIQSHSKAKMKRKSYHLNLKHLPGLPTSLSLPTRTMTRKQTTKISYFLENAGRSLWSLPQRQRHNSLP